MLSKIDTVLKRIVKNKQQVLCLSITFVVTILISLHLLPSNLIKNVDTIPIRLLFIICIGVSLYYKSYMFVLVCILSLFVIISHSNQCGQLKGFSDNSIFSYTNQVQEFMENKNDPSSTSGISETTTEISETTTGISETTPETTQKTNPETTMSSNVDADVNLNVENKFKNSMLQSLDQIQDNTFPEKNKKDNVASPKLGIGEYCPQGTIEDGPMGFDPNCISASMKI
jgi:hypothetical protein